MCRPGRGVRDAASRRPAVRCTSRRRLVAHELGLIQLKLLRARACDTRTGARALVIGLHRRSLRQFDRRRRHGPIDDGDEIGVRDAEMVEQKLAALEIVLGIVEPPKGPCRGCRSSLPAAPSCRAPARRMTTSSQRRGRRRNSLGGDTIPGHGEADGQTLRLPLA